MATVDLAAVKAHLNITGPDDDTELETFLNAALAMVTTVVGPLSGSATGRCVSVFDMLAGSVMPLPTMPVQSVETITGIWDPTPLTVSDYTLDSATGLMYGVPPGVYVVDYTAGWATLPDDLALGILELVRHLWLSQRGGGVRTGLGQPDVASPMSYAIPNRVLELLAPYTPVKVV